MPKRLISRDGQDGQDGQDVENAPPVENPTTLADPSRFFF